MNRIALHLVSFFCLVGFAAAQDKKTEEKKAEDAQAASSRPLVEFKTTKGTFVVELNQEKAPVTVANFLKYVEDKFYDGTVFHRVIADFMIQGGGFEKKGSELEQKKTREPIVNEAKNGLSNKTGTIAMARTPDPNSATSQFFINVKDNPQLDYPNPDGHGYAVFGQVVKGMEVVNAIKSVPTTSRDLKSRLPNGQLIAGRPEQDVPVEDVVILSARVVTGKAEAEKK